MESQISERPGCAGRGTITDLRHCSYTLPAIPPQDRPGGINFMAPEVRDGAAGDPMSDVYTAGAVLYYAVTAVNTVGESPRSNEISVTLVAPDSTPPSAPANLRIAATGTSQVILEWTA